MDKNSGNLLSQNKRGKCLKTPLKIGGGRRSQIERKEIEVKGTNEKKPGIQNTMGNGRKKAP